MKCPFCAHPESQVVETRTTEDDVSVRRRRRCEQCQKRFTTYESVALQMPFVVKRDGNREEFDRSKLRSSMLLALRKRPVSINHVDQAVADICEKVLQINEREIETTQLGSLVMESLRTLDPVAFIRFASVYKSFANLVEFQDFIQTAATPKAK